MMEDHRPCLSNVVLQHDDSCCQQDCYAHCCQDASQYVCQCDRKHCLQHKHDTSAFGDDLSCNVLRYSCDSDTSAILNRPAKMLRNHYKLTFDNDFLEDGALTDPEVEQLMSMAGHSQCTIRRYDYENVMSPPHRENGISVDIGADHQGRDNVEFSGCGVSTCAVHSPLRLEPDASGTVDVLSTHGDRSDAHLHDSGYESSAVRPDTPPHGVDVSTSWSADCSSVDCSSTVLRTMWSSYDNAMTTKWTCGENEIALRRESYEGCFGVESNRSEMLRNEQSVGFLMTSQTPQHFTGTMHHLLDSAGGSCFMALGSSVDDDDNNMHKRQVEESCLPVRSDGSLCETCLRLKDQMWLLQNQLEQVEGELKRKDASYQDEITHLQQENHRQLAVINEGLDLGPEAKFRSLMQYELTRVTSENLDLCETVDIRTEQICRLKKMLKAYAMKMKDGEASSAASFYMLPNAVASGLSAAAEIAAELDRECQGGEGHVSMGAVIKHRKRNYVGMFDYRKEDEGLLLKNLILDLMPRAMIGETACLPACVIYMCVRYTDHINDDDMVKSLLFGTVNSIRKAVKKHADDLETIVLWLSNTCRLQYMLKQFGGEEHPDQADGLQGQGMGLRNFDLSEYQQVLSDLAIWIYQTLLELMQDLVQHTVVPAILEHEAIAGLTGSKPAGLRGRSFSNTRDAGGQAEGNRHSLDILIRTLNSFLQLLLQLSVDQDLIQQVFCQLYYFMGACSLNNLLLRKDICNWSKGMQVRYNLSHLEQWLRDNNLQHSGALSSLDSIIQASQLLQARKTDSDVDNICEMCSKLTTAQIVKILNLYTPIDEFEERVHTSFIRKIQTCLKQRMDVPSAVSNNTLLLDTKTTFPVTFRFNLPPVHLDAITLPEALNLGFLKKL